VNHAAQEPGQGTLAGPKGLAEAAVAETMAGHQQDQERRRVVSGSPRLSAGASRHCAAGPQRGGAPTGERNGRYRHGWSTAGTIEWRMIRSPSAEFGPWRAGNGCSEADRGYRAWAALFSVYTQPIGWWAACASGAPLCSFGGLDDDRIPGPAFHASHRATLSGSRSCSRSFARGAYQA
jgi:hypothetical protein